jgi:hypothetical protein
MSELPLRWIHLDFHTSPFIEDVGVDFDADEFGAILLDAGVDVITIFASCHHGLCYHPSNVASTHPGLGFDLLGEQLKALKNVGIRANVYITVGWNEDVSWEHPEWRAIDRHGGLVERKVFTDVSWHSMCLNGGYAEYTLKYAEEVLRNYEAEGVFFDITRVPPGGCYCVRCLQSMLDSDINPEDSQQVSLHNLSVERSFMERASALVREHWPGASIFYNSRLRVLRDPITGMRGEQQHFTHWEIESLPTGGWGYNHFPLYDRYFQTLGYPRVSHTGRFHLSWGDFGGLKNEAALEYECMRMLSVGTGAAIGDQLHPRGRLDATTYDLVGSVYKKIGAISEWCVDDVPQAEIAVMALNPSASISGVLEGESAVSDEADREAMEGAMRMLLELKHQFHIVDAGAELSNYKVLVLPDVGPLENELGDRISEFIRGGGAVLATNDAIVNDSGVVKLSEFGVEYEGPSPWANAFLHVDESVSADIRQGIPDYDHVMYMRGTSVRPVDGTEVLMNITKPYFNRGWLKFVSHRTTPPDGVTDQPAVTINGKCTYISLPVFRTYRQYGNRVCRDLVRNCLTRLLPSPLVMVDGPSGLEVTVTRQEAMGRTIIHLLYAVPERRALRLDIIEDRQVVEDLVIALRVDKRPDRVVLQPQGDILATEFDGSYVHIQVARVEGYQLLVIE